MHKQLRILKFSSSKSSRNLDAKKRELAQKQGNGVVDRTAVIVTIELAERGTFLLELSYLIMNASWYPQYDVRVQPDEGGKGEVEITYIGMVQQKTGERWENAQLALSTARPSLAAVLPELQPWYLTTRQPQLPHVMMRAMSSTGGAQTKYLYKDQNGEELFGHDDTMPDMPVAASAPMPAAAVATTTIEKAGTSLIFRVGRSVNIPSDNSPHKTTIARDTLPCEFDYVTAPAIEENAHMRATITNTTEQVLLAGETNIFLSGEYVGTSRIQQIAPTEEFKIFLGIDDRIKVKREPLERGVDKGSILQRDLRITTYAYRITVHNYTATPKKIVVLDHLPVSQHERVKVRIQSIQPAPAERDKLEILKWRFTLPAHAEQKLEYRFTVEHPHDMQVIGLPS